MRVLLYFLFVLLISSFLVSCSKCTDDNGNRIKPEDSTANNKTEMIDTSGTNGKSDISPVKKLKEGQIAAESLKDFLPDNFPGYEKYPWSGGFSSDDINIWSTASAEYVHHTKGFIVCAIFDYGIDGYISDKKYLKTLPQESGMVTERIKTDDGNGYTMWNEEYRKGNLFLLVENRFVLKIEVHNIPPESGTLYGMVSYFKTKELAEAGK